MRYDEISLGTAELLNKIDHKGLYSLKFYDPNGGLVSSKFVRDLPILARSSYLPAPEKSMTQRWLREEKGITVLVGLEDDLSYSCSIYDKSMELIYKDTKYEGYDLALGSGLRVALIRLIEPITLDNYKKELASFNLATVLEAHDFEGRSYFHYLYDSKNTLVDNSSCVAEVDKEGLSNYYLSQGELDKVTVNDDISRTLAPTLMSVQDWLKDKFDIYIEAKYSVQEECWIMHSIKPRDCTGVEYLNAGCGKTYQEALDNILLSTIKLF